MRLLEERPDFVERSRALQFFVRWPVLIAACAIVAAIYLSAFCARRCGVDTTRWHDTKCVKGGRTGTEIRSPSRVAYRVVHSPELDSTHAPVLGSTHATRGYPLDFAHTL